MILDADKLETCRPWLRLVIACALDARTLARRWGPARLFMLSECAQLGHLEPIAAAHGQGHGYDVQLFRILQDVSRLRAIAKRDANAVSDSMAARYRRERR